VDSAELRQVHIKSLWSVVYKEGLKGYPDPKRRELAECQITAKYKFTGDHLRWTVNEKKEVMFLDETTISRVDPNGRGIS